MNDTERLTLERVYTPGTQPGQWPMRDVSLSVKAGAALGVLSPDRADLDQLFAVIAGHEPLARGRIRLDGTPIERLDPAQRVRRGIGVTPALAGMAHETVEALIGAAASHQSRHAGGDRAHRFNVAMRFSRLSPWRAHTVTHLPLGQRAALRLALALTGLPKLILLPRPAHGLMAEERPYLVELLHRLCREGVSLLIDEPDLETLIGVCPELVVLHHGRIIAAGSPDSLGTQADVLGVFAGPPAA
ncbi:MAG: ATP-binding cassette domain-containing protein [Geminicoccaceae bacterium]